MQKIIYLIIAVFVFPIFITGCAVVMPTIYAQYPDSVNPKDIVAVSVLVLQEHGFSFVMIDKELGLLVTDWRSAMTAVEEGVVLVLSGNVARQRMKLTITVDTTAQHICIKPIKQGSSNNYRWADVNLDDGDRELLQQITNQIVQRIGGAKTRIKWIEPQVGRTHSESPDKAVHEDSEQANRVRLLGIALLVMMGLAAIMTSSGS